MKTLGSIVHGPKTGEQAKADGYAEFNGYPHLCVDVPDGGFTISAKTSEGKRVTFSFQPYRSGGPAQCVDICYHDSGKIRMNGDWKLPLSTVIVNAGARDQRRDKDVYITCVLMADKDYQPNEGDK